MTRADRTFVAWLIGLVVSTVVLMFLVVTLFSSYDSWVLLASLVTGALYVTCMAGMWMTRPSLRSS